MEKLFHVWWIGGLEKHKLVKSEWCHKEMDCTQSVWKTCYIVATWNLSKVDLFNLHLVCVYSNYLIDLYQHFGV
jgi:hypothetical protein